MHSIDILVQNYFSLIRTPALTEFMYLLTILFDFTVPFVFVVVCVDFLVYIVRGRRHAVMFLSSLISGGILIYVLKMIFEVSRPLGGVMYVLGPSFPSYHAAIATIFFVMLMYIFDDYFQTFWKFIFNTFCVAGIFLVSFSRVYLGVHWVSDVLVGILLGLLVSYLFILLFRRVVVK